MRLKPVIRKILGTNDDDKPAGDSGRPAKSDNDPIRKIQRSLRRSMYRGESQSEMFITEAGLLQVWSEHTIGSISAFDNFDEETKNVVRLRYLRVLSILVFIAWPDLQLFRPQFMHSDLDDSKLFLDEKQVELMGSSAENFLDRQYIFKPEMIVQKHEDFIQKVDANCRLPFIDAPEHLGQGGFGAVTKRTIAPRCFVEIGPSGEKSQNLEVRPPVDGDDTLC